MKFILAQQMRALDHLTINKEKVPGHVLMERAGRGLARHLQHCCEAMGMASNASLLLVAGRGNNGGDAFVAARMLCRRHRLQVWLAGREAAVKGDAGWTLAIMKKAGVNLLELPNEEDWQPEHLNMPLLDLAVDGLLGTGSKGSPHGATRAAVDFLNRVDAPVVSVDLPTGLDSDTGIAEGPCIRAHSTVTFGCPKGGFLNAEAWAHTGSLHLVDIGIPERFVNEADDFGDGVEMIHENAVRALIPPRRRDAHKGDFGRVLMIGGSRGLTGALSMAARSALRGGAGLVTAITPASVAPMVAVNCPEAMVHGGKETPQGTLSPSALDAWRDRFSEFDVVLCGPGIGRAPETRSLVEGLLREVEKPLVLDADALSVFEGAAEALAKAKGPCILTPHPGELAALLGVSVEEIQKDRRQAVAGVAAKTGAVVVLKGAGTLVAEKKRLRINLNGNPGMATAGSGDVLAGLAAALAGQGLDPFDAASAAVFLHGRAGDYAALAKTETGLVAGDIIEALPAALR